MAYTNQGRGNGGRTTARQPQQRNNGGGGQRNSAPKINWTELQCGAFWFGKNDSMSGTISVNGKDYKVVAFVNNYKEEDKHPDYKLFFSPDDAQGDGGDDNRSAPAPRQQNRSQNRQAPSRPSRRPVDEQEQQDGVDNFLDNGNDQSL